jgi:hypothetical protein
MHDTRASGSHFQTMYSVIASHCCPSALMALWRCRYMCTASLTSPCTRRKACPALRVQPKCCAQWRIASARLLHTHKAAAAARCAISPHLGNAGAGNGSRVDVGVHICQRAPQILLNDGARLLPRHRWRPIQATLELQHVRRRKQRGAGCNELRAGGRWRWQWWQCRRWHESEQRWRWWRSSQAAGYWPV